MRAVRQTSPQLQVVPKAEPQFDVTFKPVMTRREAEILFEIDSVQNGDNPAWTAFFVESLVEFVVYGSRPTGQVSDTDAQWIVSCVGTEASASVPALLRAIILQAENVPGCLIHLAMRCGAMRGPSAVLI